MEDYIEKIEVNLFELIKNINNPSILEFGVQNGASTIRFLDLCNQNNGYLYSVDSDTPVCLSCSVSDFRSCT